MKNKKRKLNKKVINTIYIINYISIILLITRYLIYSISINNIIVYILFMMLIYGLLSVLLLVNNKIKDILQKIRF